MKLKPDARLRRQFMVPESFSHPAKMHSGLLLELVDRYTKSGDWVLDPMGGSGTTLLAALSGRNVCIVEMESHFITPMKASWAKMRQQAMLGCEMGKVVIIQGDARCLPLGRADVVVTSPPYEGTCVAHCVDGVARQVVCSIATHKQGYTRPAAVITSPPYEGTVSGGGGIALEGDGLTVQGLPVSYTRPAAVITSPPYEASVSNSSEHNGIDWELTKRSPTDYAKGTGGAWGNTPFSYTRPAAVITSPPYEGILSSGISGIDHTKMARGDESQQACKVPGGSGNPIMGYTRPTVDAVVTSPPYDNRLADTFVDDDPKRMSYVMGGANPGRDNIGNLRGEKYWEAMRLVYAECFRVLAPGGVMVLVTKGYTRDGQYVDLPQQTVDECEALGFKLRERWALELWGLSFWRILQQRRDPAAFDERLRFEPVLVFDKPCPV